MSALDGPPRVAFFGLLGSGNIGNQASLDAMLAFVRAAHPKAVISCICSGPAEIERQYGIPAIPITWYQQHGPGRSRSLTVLRKSFGKVADVVRMPFVVRRYDLIIVPGMGVFETTLELRPWGWPWALLLMVFWARATGVPVAFVNVGVNVPRERSFRWLFGAAARLAPYRSYRDEYSRDAMRMLGVDTSRDEVGPDVAFALPEPASLPAPDPSGRRTVALGVIAYYGSSADRARADEIYATYTAKIVEFARWLVDEGYRIRLVIGDPSDEEVVEAVYADLRQTRPDLPADRVVYAPVETIDELTAQLAEADVVVASRYHNVVAALRLSKPTVSISYGVKNDLLMEQMQLAEFRQPIQGLDLERLIDQFQALESRAATVVPVLRARNAEYVASLEKQFTALSEALFGGRRVSRTTDADGAGADS